MNEIPKVAVLGLYSSGSSAMAGVLSHLGVSMGNRVHPYYFEPAELSKKLRKWWCEPELIEVTSSTNRMLELRQWVEDVELETHPKPKMIGAKHPLLLLSANELLTAWGPETKIIWARRPIEQSIISLANRGWFAGKEVRLQKALWKSLLEFLNDQEHLKVDFKQLCHDTEHQVRRVQEFLELEVTDEQFRLAVAGVLKK